MQMTDDWAIEPFMAVGPIDLRWSRSDLQAHFGALLKAQRKGSGAWVTEIDALCDLSLQISYDDQGRVAQVLISAPLKLSFNGISLVGRRLGELERDLIREGHSLKGDPLDLANVDCPTLGLALYVESGRVEAVAVLPPQSAD